MTRMQGAVGSPRQRCHQGTPGMFAKPFLLHQQRHALGCLTPPSLFPNPPLQEHPPPQNTQTLTHDADHILMEATHNLGQRHLQQHRVTQHQRTKTQL